MSWFSTKLLVVNCDSGLSNLSILDQSDNFWSFVLEIVIPLLSKHRIIQMFYNMMPVHSSSSGWVSILTSDPLWTVKSFVGLLSDSVLHIQSPYEFFPWYIMPLVNCILCLANHALLLSLCIYFWNLWYMLLRCPDGLNLCLPLIRKNPKVFTSHTFPVFYQIKFQHYSFIKMRSEWKVMH